MARVSIAHVVAAIKKVQAMDTPQRFALAEEIYRAQPHMLASCLVQKQMGVDEVSVNMLLNILLVCFQAMKESPYHWPLISEEEQDRYLQRYVGAVRFSEEMADPVAGDQARRQYVESHPEQPLLAYVMGENNRWLADVAERGAEAESDKYVMMASVNLVNCIAYAQADAIRA
jgi:hypothetical protein